MGVIQKIKQAFGLEQKKDVMPPESIAVSYARDKDGNLMPGMVNTIPFKPNMLIERCGKIYRVDGKGTQRFVGYKDDANNPGTLRQKGRGGNQGRRSDAPASA